MVRSGLRPAGRRRALALLVLCGTLLLTATGCSDEPPPLALSSGEPVAGKVAYQTDEGVFVQPIGGRPSLVAAGAGYPRWSADGKRLAAVRGRDILVIGADSAPQAVARADQPRAVAWGPAGDWLYFTDADRVRAVHLRDGRQRVVARGFTFRELDIHPDGRTLVATVRSGGVRIRSFDLAGGESRELARGCSASFSPDGELVTNLLGGHREIGLISTDSGRTRRVLEAPDGVTYDNQYWTNHPDWIAGETEGRRNDIILIHARTGAVHRVTDVGDAARGDVFIE